MVETPKIGKMIRFLHAGESAVTCHSDKLSSVPKSIQFSSPAFSHENALPMQYTGDHEDISPPLTWENLPDETQEVAILIEDADVPMPSSFVHAIAYGIDSAVSFLPEGSLSEHKHGQTTPHSLRMGKNSYGKPWYKGPTPIRGHGRHRYYFQIFALGQKLNFRKPPSRQMLIRELQKHALAQGELIGTCERD